MGEYETSEHYTNTGESGQVWSGSSGRRGGYRLVSKGRQAERTGTRMDSMIFNTEKALERADELVKEGGWEVPEGITPEAYDRIRDQREGK